MSGLDVALSIGYIAMALAAGWVIVECVRSARERKRNPL